MVYNGCRAHSHGIAGLGHSQLCNSSDVACFQLLHLNLILATQDIELADLFLSILIHIVHHRVALKGTGTNFHQ